MESPPDSLKHLHNTHKVFPHILSSWQFSKFADIIQEHVIRVESAAIELEFSLRGELEGLFCGLSVPDTNVYLV